MRLVQVAKALGMTGQQLRKELMEVNFGVKPTDREVSGSLATGIIRFLAHKHGISVDLETLGMDNGDDSDSEGGITAATPEDKQDVQVEESVEPEATASVAPQKQESFNVLRKLSLENVSTEAIAKQQEIHRRAVANRSGKQRRPQQRIDREGGDRFRHGKRMDRMPVEQAQIKKKEGLVMLPDQISVKEFAEKTGLQVPLVIQTLMKNGVMATITQSIDYDTAAIVAVEHGVEVQKEQRSAKAEDLFSRNLRELLKDDPELLEIRPPIVVVMGHVDHGKTAILDAIRQTDVVSQEAGGITQHIGAYQVEHRLSPDQPQRKITFLDTPGHEAFTAMRARGAQVTDIAIIVVSAEEGVKPTTVEAINHAKEAGVPIIVAINKIDKERADPDRVKGELAALDLQPEEWGGKTPVVNCSAVTKQGIPDLLDHILIIAEIQDIRANPNRPAVATIIESHLDISHGALATVIVNTGTLRIGDTFVCGGAHGRVKVMIDANGKRLEDITPSGAVRVSGFEETPNVGDILQVVRNDREARELTEAFTEHERSGQHRSFADLVTRLSEGKLKQLKIVLKADAQGSLEAIHAALQKQQEGGPVSAKVIHGAVGPVSESDVMMAAASDGLVLAFNVPISSEVGRTAQREGVQVREYTVLYELLDEVMKLLEGLVEPVEEERVIGHLEIRGVFLTKKSEQIVGGKVTDGIIKRVPFRLMRDGKNVGTGRITSVKHVDKDIKEAKEGSECGVRVDTSVSVLEGDVLEAYTKELKKKEA